MFGRNIKNFFWILGLIFLLKNTEALSVNTRVDYLSLRIPDQTSSLGLLGVHLDTQPISNFQNWYVGLGGYGAVRGQNSGFFALGLETGFEKKIDKNWVSEGGVFLGSGGGHDLASRIGNGGFFESHVGLLYDLDDVFWFGPAISHFQFFEGNIRDNQIALEWLIPMDLPRLQPNLFKLTSKNYFELLGTAEFPSKHSRNLAGDPMADHLEFVGAEYGHYWSRQSYLFLNMNGAVAGNQDGYAEALAGLGYQEPLGNSDWSVLGQLGVGSAGGGGVNTRGGFIVSPTAGLEWDPMDDWGLALKGGYFWSPNLDNAGNPGNSYQGWVLNAGVKYYFGALGYCSEDFPVTHPQNNNPELLAASQIWRVRVGDQVYIDPDRTADSNSNQTMHLLAVKLDGFINPNFYLTGQTAFAYTDNAAGYFSGMLGMGAQTSAYHHVALYAELLGGAAGGAGLEIGTGFLVEPLVGLNYQFTPGWELYGSVGQTFSPNHGFDSPTVDMGVGYSFGTV